MFILLLQVGVGQRLESSLTRLVWQGGGEDLFQVGQRDGIGELQRLHLHAADGQWRVHGRNAVIILR